MTHPNSMDAHQRHLHTPGELSRAGALDVGLKCAHSCRFCYYSYLDGSEDQFRGIRQGSFRSFEDCPAILVGFARQGFMHFDITAREACDGVAPGYLARFGDAELRPYADMALVGPLLKARLDYAPAFALKLGGRAAMRPGAGSAACPS